MTEQRGWGIPEQCLLPDAVVAFVDGELSPVAHDRVVAHISRCAQCAAETRDQRQARTEVREAETPAMSAAFLAALRAIPVDTDLPIGADTLAITEDGQLVAVQRPDRAAQLGAGPMLGSSQRLGSGNVLRARGWPGRRAVQGAGVVAAGLVLGALAVVGPYALSGSGEHPTEPARGDGPTANGNDVVQANFAGDGHSGFGAPNRVAASTPAAPVLAVQENRLTARPR